MLNDDGLEVFLGCKDFSNNWEYFEEDAVWIAYP
jgi:hypothetical protein